MTISREAVLAIDEGTTGTRAAWVTADGQVGPVEYRRLPQPRVQIGGVVDVDAEVIWAETREVIRATVAQAKASGIRLTGISLANQRATTVMWDATTGRAVAPAVGWQDTRYSDRLAAMSTDWNDLLIDRTGRGPGVRSTHLWIVEMLQSPDLVRLRERGALRVGTIDSWLIWQLTGGKSYVTTATNAAATGAYDFEGQGYFEEWLDALDIPRGLLPPIADDASALGESDPSVVDIAIPILSALGDQLAAIIGLGVAEPGAVACVHGTGSFIDISTGRQRISGASFAGTTTVLALRADHRARFSVESYSPATGGTLRWLCETARLFSDPAAISALAHNVSNSGGVSFLPSLAGMRAPVVSPAARGGFRGLELSTTREQIAYSVLEGIANSLVDALELAESVAGLPLPDIVAGGGLSSSNTLLQIQADLGGRPVKRAVGSDVASLRGAAFVGAQEILWSDLSDAMSTVRTETVFEPTRSCADREEARDRWSRLVHSEVAEASTQRTLPSTGGLQ